MIAATSGEVEALLGVDAEAALAAGAVTREKVQGRWLYFEADGPGLVEALDLVEWSARSVLAEWLLNPAQYLLGQVVRLAGDGGPSRTSCNLLVHELCARDRLDGLALLSQGLQPYLAFHMTDDRGEVARQVNAMREVLSARGRVGWNELPDTKRPVPRKVWRVTVLAHGFWLGLGWRPEQDVLVTW